MKHKRTKWLKTNIFSLIAFASIIFIVSCEKEPKNKKPNTNHEAGRKALVLNEGSLGNGNASLSLLNLDSQIITNNIFQYINGQEIGDILQSALVLKDKIYLAVTNSNVVRILDKKTLKLVDEISIQGPKYIYPITEDLAYVSGYNNGKIHLMQLSTNQVIGSIVLPYRNVEKILIENNKAYVCNWDTSNNQLYIINTANHTLQDSISLAGKAPHSIFKDQHEKIWVFAGNKHHNSPASITQIKNDQVINSFSFDPSFEIVKPHYHKQKDEVYYISIDYYFTKPQGVYKMKSTDIQLPTNSFIPAGNYQYFYSVQVDELTNDIYISDPKSFIQRGDLIRYNAQGEQLNTLETNIGPNGILFLP